VPGRSDEEIVMEALEIINPPSDQREATRSEVLTKVELVRLRAQAWLRTPSSSEQKEQLENYLKNLRAAKRTFILAWDPDSGFLTHLNAEIARIKSAYDFRINKIPKGARRWDWIAVWATAAASLCLPAERRTLTNGGPWHCLSMLFYEAVTGKPDCDRVLKYMAAWGHAFPAQAFWVAF
jgi:hypothetical protein